MCVTIPLSYPLRNSLILASCCVRLASRAKELGWSEEIELEGPDAVSILGRSAIIKKSCALKNISTKRDSFLSNVDLIGSNP